MAQDVSAEVAVAAWQAKALDCERCIYQGLPLAEEAVVLMEKAYCYWQMQAPEMATKTLDRIALYAVNDSLRSEIFALRALYAPEALSLDTFGENDGKAGLPAETLSIKQKNPETARWFSMIPGAGHFYVGAVGEGLFSLFLNAASISFIVFELSSGLYVGGLLGGGILLSQTYLGGTERAIQLTNQYNREQRLKAEGKTPTETETQVQRIDHPF